VVPGGGGVGAGSSGSRLAPAGRPWPGGDRPGASAGRDFVSKGAPLRQAPAPAGLLFDSGFGFGGGGRWGCQGRVFQRGLVGGAFVGLALPRQVPHPFPATLGECVEVALDAAAGDVGAAADRLVGATLAFQPPDLHLLLDAWVRVAIALVANRGEVFGAEGEAAHEELPCRCHPAVPYESQPRLAIVPDSCVASIVSIRACSCGGGVPPRGGGQGERRPGAPPGQLR